MTFSPRFSALVSKVSQQVPGFKIRFKNKSVLMWIFAILVFPFNRRFMRDFTTTVGKTTYFPSEKWLHQNQETAFYTLAHEYQHLWDNYTRGTLACAWGYIFPQALAIFALPAVFGNWWLVWLVALLALAPWPSRGRTEYEMRGYSVTYALWFWDTKGRVPDSVRDGIVRQFTGWNYYCMWPYPSQIRTRLGLLNIALRTGANGIDSAKILQEVPAEDVRRIVLGR
jgi:hypothetical protein